MEAEMRAAAKQLEFERAAALRDEIQQIRLRVLEQDQSIIVGRAAERAASSARRGGAGPAEPGLGASVLEVTSVEVVPVGGGPIDGAGDGTDGQAGSDGQAGGATAADWLPGIRDEHEDETGWAARWLDRPTWDRTVTPNVRRRTGTRPGRRGRPRGY
jgi:hypothetical protein